MTPVPRSLRSDRLLITVQVQTVVQKRKKLYECAYLTGFSVKKLSAVLCKEQRNFT